MERITIILLSKSNENGAPKESPNAVTNQPRTVLSPRTGNAHRRRSSQIFEKGRGTGVWKVDAAGYEWLAAVVRRHEAHGFTLGALSAASGRLERYKAGASLRQRKTSAASPPVRMAIFAWVGTMFYLYQGFHLDAGGLDLFSTLSDRLWPPEIPEVGTRSHTGKSS